MRRVAVVTTSRADYGHLFWPMRDIDAHPDLTLDLIVAGAHLETTFGHTVDAIVADGFDVSATVRCLDAEDSDVGMARTIARLTAGLADIFAVSRPDLLLLIADRHEMLAPASVALALRIPIAHIEGGDVSEGAIDDAVRNALTKMSHLHFAPTLAAHRRVLAMGEEPWRVQQSGAPSLDHLRRSTLPARADVEAALGVRLGDPVCVVAYHPVTLHQDTAAEGDAMIEALRGWRGQIVFCFPNADAGYRVLVRRARAFCASRTNATLHVNLDHLVYWGLLRHAAVLAGNSSSGIMEAASLALPVVDVGDRQRGRTRADNVIHAQADPSVIVAALTKAASGAFRAAVADVQNPYGDGHASERIVAALAGAPSRDRLLFKAALPLTRAIPVADDADPDGAATFVWRGGVGND